MDVNSAPDPLHVSVCHLAPEVLPNQRVQRRYRAILRRHRALKVLEPGAHELLVRVLLPVVLLPAAAARWQQQRGGSQQRRIDKSATLR